MVHLMPKEGIMLVLFHQIMVKTMLKICTNHHYNFIYLFIYFVDEGIPWYYRTSFPHTWLRYGKLSVENGTQDIGSNTLIFSSSSCLAPLAQFIWAMCVGGACTIQRYAPHNIINEKGFESLLSLTINKMH